MMAVEKQRRGRRGRLGFFNYPEVLILLAVRYVTGSSEEAVMAYGDEA